MPDPVVEDLRAAAGDGIQTRVAEPRDGVANRKPGHLGDVGDLGGGEAVQVDGEPGLDGPKQVLIPIDLQIGVQTALHKDAGTPNVDGFLDLLEDDFPRQNVPFLVPQRPVEGAEAAILGAKVGVVDVAIDDIGNHTLGMQPPAQRVGSHADADEVVGPEKVASFGRRKHLAPGC